jgi:hypothetical protein
MVRLSAKHFAYGRGLSREGCRPNRKPLAPLPRGFEVDMDEAPARGEARARVEAETEKPNRSRVRRVKVHLTFAYSASPNASVLWFAISMSKAAPSRYFDRVAPPTAQLCSALR